MTADGHKPHTMLLQIMMSNTVCMCILVPDKGAQLGQTTGQDECRPVISDFSILLPPVV